MGLDDMSKAGWDKNLQDAIAANQEAESIYSCARCEHNVGLHFPRCDVINCPCQEFVQRKDETINHPSHYNAHPSGIECIEIVEHMNFNIGNAIKYLWRAGLKGNQTEDLKKAEWYVRREIDRLDNELER